MDLYEKVSKHEVPIGYSLMAIGVVIVLPSIVLVALDVHRIETVTLSAILAPTAWVVVIVIGSALAIVGGIFDDILDDYRFWREFEEEWGTIFDVRIIRRVYRRIRRDKKVRNRVYRTQIAQTLKRAYWHDLAPSRDEKRILAAYRMYASRKRAA